VNGQRSRDTGRSLHTWRGFSLHEIPAIRYARLSDADPADTDNVDRQERITTAFGAYNVTHPTIKDNDRSASMHRRRDREGFEHLFDLLDRGEVGVVLVSEWSRLVRDDYDLARLFRTAKRHGALYVVASGGMLLDLATSFGKQSARMLTMQSAGESDSTSERRTRSNGDLRKQGHVGVGVCAFGWLGKRHGHDREDGMTQHPQEAAEIRAAAEHVLDGWSWSEVARDWNTRGLTLPRGGRAWHVTSVKSVLLNPRNAGILRYSGEPDAKAAWQPILDRKTYDRLVAKVNAARRGPDATPGPRTLVSGLMYCGECHARLVVHAQGHHRPKGPYRYWKCKKTAANMHVCATTAIRDIVVEPAIVEVVHRVLSGQRVPGAPDYRRRRRNDVRARREDAVKRFAKFTTSYLAGDGRITDDQYDAEETKHVALLHELDAQAHDVDVVSEQRRLIGEGERIIAAWDEMDDDDRNAVLRAFIERVDISARPEGERTRGHDPHPLARVDIVWRRPME
jgi:DNA invertase Pin-like site-specific DNA recombinase